MFEQDEDSKFYSDFKVGDPYLEMQLDAIHQASKERKKAEQAKQAEYEASLLYQIHRLMYYTYSLFVKIARLIWSPIAFVLRNLLAVVNDCLQYLIGD